MTKNPDRRSVAAVPGYGFGHQGRGRTARTTLSIVLLAITASAAGCGGTRVTTAEEPLEWTGPIVPEVDYIVGDLQHAPLRYEFRNRSSHTVQFLESKADCKCTSIELPKGKFAPGAVGEIKFSLGLSDAPGHVVSSHSFIGYECGPGKYSRILNLAVNKRRSLEAEPEILELGAVSGPTGNYCEGRLVLNRYTKPGRDFDEYAITQSGVQGDVEIVKDEGWGTAERDAGFLKSSRAIWMRTTSKADSSGNGKLNIFSGTPPEGKFGSSGGSARRG